MGLRESCRVPVRFVRGYAGRSQGPRDALAKLAGLYQWEAWLAESEDRQKDAARADLDLVRLGVAAGYGGLESDVWFGYDLMNGGLAGLRRRLHRLEIEPCLDAIQALVALDDETRIEPYARVIARQKQYDRAEGWAIPVAIVQFVSLRSRRVNREMIATANEVLANLRLTEVELALRVHRIRNSSDPESLGELTPGVVRILPRDPFSQLPFRYARTKKGHLLYSVGPDERDDEGAELARSSSPPRGDILPNTLVSKFEPIIAR